MSQNRLHIEKIGAIKLGCIRNGVCYAKSHHSSAKRQYLKNIFVVCDKVFEIRELVLMNTNSWPWRAKPDISQPLKSL